MQSSESRQVAAPAVGKAQIIRRKMATGLVALGIVAGVSLGAAAPSQAATSSCSNGACTVYLNWNETVALSNGKVPTFSLGDPRLTIAVKAGLIGHRWIAKGWVNRGNCVAFTANIRPWVSQGMLGWRCR